MKNRLTSTHRLFPWLLVSSLCFSVVDCSLIGKSIGAGIDATHSALKAVNMDTLRSIQPGKDILVLTCDGYEFEGRLAGIREMGESEYARRYRSALVHLDSIVWLPRLGDPLSLHKKDGTEILGRFAGFDPAIVLYRIDIGRPIEAIHLDQLDRARYGFACDMSADSLRGLLAGSAVPFESVLELETSLGTKSFPLERVSAVGVNSVGHDEWNLFAIGLAVDAAFLGYLAYKVATSSNE